MKNRFIGIVLVLTLILIAAVCPAVAAGYPDMSGHWSRDYVNMLTGKGIINGYPDNTFRPEDSINADAFIKMAVILKGHNLANGSQYWASTFIAKAKEIGLVADGEFDSYERPVTRAEMARIVVRSLNETYPEDMNEYKRGISDIGALPEYSDYILKAYVKGIITGYPDGSFKGGNNANRAEAAAIIARMIEQGFRKVPQKPGPEVYNGVVLPSDEEFLKNIAVPDNSSSWTYKPDMDNKRLMFLDRNTQNIDLTLTGAINPNIDKQVFALARLLIGYGRYINVGYDKGSASTPSYVMLSYNRSAKDQWDNGSLFYLSLYDDKYRNGKDSFNNIFSEKQFGHMVLKRLYKEQKPDYITLFDLDGEVLSKLHDSLFILFGEQTGEKIFNLAINEYIRIINTSTADVVNSVKYVVQVDNLQVDITDVGTGAIMYFSYIE